MKIRCLLSFPVLVLALAPGSSGAQTERAYVLPNPLTTLAGTRINDKKDWPARRAEILELFRAHVYGRVMGAQPKVSFSVARTDATAMAGVATLKEIKIRIDNGPRNLTIDVVLFVPNKRKGPAPVFLLVNNRGADNHDPTRKNRSDFWPAEEVIARGFAVAAFQVGDVDPDRDDGFKNGIHGVLESPGAARPADAWGTLAAWAWGASRVVDYMETDADLDARKVAVVGHSRGGKTALWAGAEDTRIAIAISNDSGCGGAAIARRRKGETVVRITGNFPHWFNDRYDTYANREDDMPVDQHMLMTLMAPRAVYVASAEQDLNADPRGEYLSLFHAAPVFALWGLAGLPMASPPVDKPVHAGMTGYHIRSGSHNLTLYDWTRFMDFADRVYATPMATPMATADGATKDAVTVDAAPPTADVGRPGTTDAVKTISDSASPSPSHPATANSMATTPKRDARAFEPPSVPSDSPAPVNPQSRVQGAGCGACALNGRPVAGATFPVVVGLALAFRRRCRRSAAASRSD